MIDYGDEDLMELFKPKENEYSRKPKTKAEVKKMGEGLFKVKDEKSNKEQN